MNSTIGRPVQLATSQPSPLTEALEILGRICGRFSKEAFNAAYDAQILADRGFGSQATRKAWDAVRSIHCDQVNAAREWATRLRATVGRLANGKGINTDTVKAHLAAADRAIDKGYGGRALSACGLVATTIRDLEDERERIRLDKSRTDSVRCATNKAARAEENRQQANGHGCGQKQKAR